MRLVVTGGGTGGHVYPAIAIADYFKRLSAEIIFIGSASGPEGATARGAGLDFEGLEISGLMGKNPLAAIRAIALFAKAFMRCRRLFGETRPDCVVGTGGYAAAPACFAAAWLKIPLVLHEMNFRPGLVTRILSRRAGAVAVAFGGTKELLPGVARVRVTGIPVRKEIAELADEAEKERAMVEGLEEFELLEGRRTLLVFGGSQGALALNEATWETLPRVSDRRDLQVLHFVGNKGYGDPRRISLEEELSGGLLYRALPYCERMDLAYAVTDLALARAGAGTVSELAAAGIPSVLVPYPYATSGHQELNARELERAGAARVVTQDGGSAAMAVAEALDLLDDEDELGRMRKALAGSARAKGTEGIAALVEELT